MSIKLLRKKSVVLFRGSHKAILCGVFLLSAMSAFAQWGVGVTAGYTNNVLDIKPGYAYDMRYKSMGGFTVGVPVKYQFFDWLAVRSELTFVQKGYKMERTGYFKGIYDERRNNYLQLPIMANFSFGGDRLRGFFNAGGYVGYWLTSDQKGAIRSYFSIDQNENYVNPGTVYHYNESVPFDSRRDKRFEAGLLAGAGISYKLTKRVELQLEARYYYSLTDMQKQYMNYISPRYNNTLAIQAGCMITIGKNK